MNFDGAFSDVAGLIVQFSHCFQVNFLLLLLQRMARLFHVDKPTDELADDAMVFYSVSTNRLKL
jgi:predicted AAA+ superfamily ATPase